MAELKLAFNRRAGRLPGMSASHELPGLSVSLDKLIYHHGGELPPDKPHAFIYYLTIRNDSEDTVTLLGRKWIIDNADGSRAVIEGDKIVGETPTLAPGEHFSYNSFHIGACDAHAHGSFHGVAADGHHIFVRIPAFDMLVPRA